MREFVDRFDDPRLDDYRNLSDAALRATRGAFVAEGRLVVTRLLASPRFLTRSLMLTRPACDALADVLDGHPSVPLYEVAQATMNGVTGLDMHRGCLAIGERPQPSQWDDRLHQAGLVVALERVGNADNVGGIFRHAAAFGADVVLLDDACADPLYRKALRTSMGASLDIPFVRTLGQQWLDVLASFRDSGGRLVAMTPADDAMPVSDAVRMFAGQRTMLVLGHEGEGLSAATLAHCDVRARIPMRVGVDSLNVATAAAIALYEIRRTQSVGT